MFQLPIDKNNFIGSANLSLLFGIHLFIHFYSFAGHQGTTQNIQVFWASSRGLVVMLSFPRHHGPNCVIPACPTDFSPLSSQRLTPWEGMAHGLLFLRGMGESIAMNQAFIFVRPSFTMQRGRRKM